MFYHLKVIHNFLPKVGIKEYNIMIDEQNVFDLRTHEEILIGHGDDYITGSLLSYPYFKENY